MANGRKIINDPVFGFITIPNEFLLKVLQHPYLQRLSRIRQLGLSSMVYPGAMHTRFLHSIGAMHLTSEAISTLRQKGIDITDHERNSTLAAILLHDIGHGPFSHVLEHTLVSGISHEDISLRMMQEMNSELNGELDDAIRIFTNTYPKHFLHQLISSQLDMDRLDYLCRDSFFCGVSEGTVASQRIIKMMNVAENRLVVEQKGIYSVEKFLVARRLMYWQVYLHKTSVAAEELLRKILLRAKHLATQGAVLFTSPALHYFLYNDITIYNFEQGNESLAKYAQLDDSDILSAIKAWQQAEDIVLRTLCSAFINRHLFKTLVLQEPATAELISNYQALYAKHFSISESEANYMFSVHSTATDTYSPKDDSIGILYADGSIRDIADASDMLNIEVLTKRVEKHYLFYYQLQQPI